MSLKNEDTDVLDLHNAVVLMHGDGFRLILHDTRYPGCFVNRQQAVEFAQEILRRYDVKAAA